MATIGRIEEFREDKEEWSQYAERLEHFFAANGITNDNKKRSVFLTVIGAKAYKQLRSLIAPAKPGESDFATLSEAMKNHYSPAPSEIVQRFQFNSRFRRPGESVSTYVAELRALAEFCNFGDTLNLMIRDRLVCGINDENTQRLLLAEKELTYEKALEIARSQEAAAQNVQTLRGMRSRVGPTTTQGPPMEPINAVKSGKQPARQALARDQRSTKDSSGACYRCGNTGHKPSQCKFLKAKCHGCGKIGHLKKVCRSSNPQEAVRTVEDTSTSTQEQYELYHLEDATLPKTSENPYKVTLTIEGKSVQMEIDTGASLSLVSEHTYQELWPTASLQKTAVKLKTYTGTPLKVLGLMYATVCYEQQTVTLPLLVVAGVGASLVGRNWLEKIILNWKAIHSVNIDQLQAVLNQYSEVFKPGVGTLKDYKAHIFIDSTVPPKFCKARSVPYAMRPLVETQLDKLVQEDILTPIQYAEWAAPIVPVMKADRQSVRICGDFKQTVNKASPLDKYPIPKIEDLFSQMAGGQKFTKLDMSQAYQQICLDDESKKYVAINTSKGLFQYNRLPFGISSAPGIFQRVMENILRGISKVVVYLDDILITGANDDEHLKHLSEVLSRMQQAGLRLREDKCEFMSPSVVYLGYCIDAQGLHPTRDKVAAIQQAPTPQNCTELRAYLGLLNYYSKFMPNLSTKLAALYKLLQKTTPWHWGPNEEKAFKNSKQLLLSSQLLVHFDPSKELILCCDASAYGIGAVLAHRTSDGVEQPIGFVSRTLTRAERNYSQIEKEALSCIFGIKRFHTYLYGHRFTLITDHKPLLSLFKEQKAIPHQASGRIQRWALVLAGYEYTISFRPTESHSNADALSRLPLHTADEPVPAVPETVLLLEQLDDGPFTAQQVKYFTARDPCLSQVLTFVQSGWPNHVSEDELKPYWRRRSELSVQFGCILWGYRVIVPPQGRTTVLQELHGGHPGITRMKSLARGIVWWPKLDEEIETMVRSCSVCQTQRDNPPAAPLIPWKWPSRPWYRLHIDYAGPFLGHMWLIIIDAHSKWLEIFQMSSTTSTATIQCLRDVFARFGLPERIVTDNAPNLVSTEFSHFLKQNGIKQTTSAPYHPASNGLAERAVKIFKNGMKKMTEGSLRQKLARFLFSYRITPQSTTGVSPAELLMGRKLRSVLDLLNPNVTDRVESSQSAQKASHDKRAQSRNFMLGDVVYAHSYGQGSAWVKGTIVDASGPHNFTVEVNLSGQLTTWKRHVDQLRKCFEEITVPSKTQQPTDTSAVSEEEEEEDNTSGITEVWSNLNPSGVSQQSSPNVNIQSTVSGSIPRHNPLRNRKPPDRLTY